MGQDIQHIRERRGMHIGFKVDSQKEIDCWEDLSVGGQMLKRISREIVWGGMN
jgi:hypothetical protein